MKIWFPPQPLPTGELREPGIGDCLFAEPAMRHLAETTGEPIDLFLVGNAAVRDLFDGNPAFRLQPAGAKPTGRYHRVSNDRAYRRSLYLTARHAVDGYYEQFGLDPDEFPAVERRPKLFGEPFDQEVVRGDFITIAPFSNSCAAQLMPGRCPSKQAPLSLWEDFAKAAPMRVVCTCHEGAPDIQGVDMIRGKTLRQAATIVKSSRCLVSIATGMLAIAGAMDCDIVYLPGAEPPWFSDPLTHGRSIALYDPCLRWTTDAVLSAVERVLEAPRG